MNKERLQHLITILEAVPPEKLDMDNWYQNSQHTCGAAACAFGHAALDPVFNAQGLFVLQGGDYDVPAVEVESDYLGWQTTGYPAAAKFFDITFSEAVCLFDPDDYYDEDGDNLEDITAADVIARIKTLLEK